MNGKVKILFFCMVFVAGRAFCQNQPQFRYTPDVLRFYKLSALKPVKKQSLRTIQEEQKHYDFRESTTITAYSVIPVDYYSSNLGFVCKKELQLEKAISIPLKFRLGSVQQCDWLEGKTRSQY